ncbi:MAG TPA: selenocysteine-specific translation elongation factor [Pyrinomonadaceae bacterium]|jgi:selenocysteine-specific elongation factor|nr:selenocysteine-specific translation elongation factor [Pyrinomonadaceae bacterium]
MPLTGTRHPVTDTHGSIIIGTAGHIDHGKSSLVQALTGKDPDRLPEEKRRGITIDLGFADLDLGDVRVGFVDVPGHERFVKNMLAGVHGIDAVALVIAADEGVMPQTREHFEICRLLGVGQGLVVLSKIDLVEEELLALVRAEAEELVAGSFLEGAPILPVSVRSKAGLEELRAAMRHIAESVPARSLDFVVRLPIDRAFTMKGFGAVVTGTLVSGEIAAGDELELLPASRRVRARGVQVHGTSVPLAQSGQRTAVNLAGVDAGDIERGMVLAAVGRLRPTQIIDVELSVLPGAPRAIRTRSRLRVHIGSAEALARVRVLNTRGDIPPGETGFAQLRFEKPVIALHDERFIVRSYSPAETVGGGLVLDPQATKHRGKELAATDRRLRVLLEPDRSDKLAVFVEASGDRGLRLSDIAARTGWSDEVVSQVAKATRAAIMIDADGVLISTENFERLSRVALEAVKLHHQRDPLSRGLARETLRERHFAHAAPEIFRSVIARLEKDGELAVEKDLVRASAHEVELSPADAKLHETIASSFEQAALEPPALDQVFTDAGISSAQRAHGRKILQLLLDSGTLVRVQGEMFFHARAIERLKQLLREYALDHEPDRLIDVAKFKALAGVSRKYAIPLLEYLDSLRVTIRAGDKRIILK